MASGSRPLSVKILALSLFILLLSLSDAVRPVNAIPDEEFESMLGALRAHGYNLFSNAITTSDLHLDLSPPYSPPKAHGNNSHPHRFTLFAPTDSALFSLDMTQTSSSYTDNLRLHVVPRRLLFSDLRSLASLPTLLPSRALRVTIRPVAPRPGPRSTHFIVSVNDVDVVFPGLYYGRYVAIHGLNGVLSLRLQSPFTYGYRPPVHSSTRRRRFPPETLLNTSLSRRFLLRPVNHTTSVSPIIPSTDLPLQNRTTVSPVIDVTPNNRTKRLDIPQVNRMTPEDEGIHRYSLAEPPVNLGISPPEDHIPVKNSRSIGVSLMLGTGNDDDGDESSSPLMDVLEDGIMGEKSWPLDGQTEYYTLPDND